MKYYKQSGSIYDTYYALDESAKLLLVIEERFADACREFTDCIIVSACSPERGTYDTVGVEVIKTYTEITSKEFNNIKKAASDFVKKIEEVE